MTKVYIDPGHGGKDPGAVRYLVEKDVNLAMALACRDYLVKKGIEVKMSRTGDKNTDINDSASEANRWGADYAVSVHNNAGGGIGFEVFCSVKGGDGRRLAGEIEKEVKKIRQVSRGIKTKADSGGNDYFGFIRLTDMPAVILEGVFVDSRKDSKKADTLKKQKKFGEAYAKGILNALEGRSETVSKGISQDGYWGRETTTLSQKVLGTYPDGIVSGQPSVNKKYLVGADTGSWKFSERGSKEGSAMVKALQKLTGAETDGYCGKETVKALQRFLDDYRGKTDGLLGPETVKAWQRYLNRK